MGIAEGGLVVSCCSQSPGGDGVQLLYLHVLECSKGHGLGLTLDINVQQQQKNPKVQYFSAKTGLSPLTVAVLDKPSSINQFCTIGQGK